ncbi:hypothetical protein [Granulicella tundricola]|uniref:hypothetical protein n=1 Tax=Granulicella tundricola TaxID=940615 RepID=UPI0012FBAE34|nr:hypothetical protein [Granulicella tundricola]
MKLNPLTPPNTSPIQRKSLPTSQTPTKRRSRHNHQRPENHSPNSRQSVLIAFINPYQLNLFAMNQQAPSRPDSSSLFIRGKPFPINHLQLFSPKTPVKSHVKPPSTLKII